MPFTVSQLDKNPKLHFERHELLDLVNERDEAVGTITQGDFYKPNGREGLITRAADAFVMNAEGKVWVPRRALHKAIAPGAPDFSVAEHVQSGETYLDAILRGFQEELSLDVSPEELESLGKLKPTENMPYFSMVYRYRANSIQAYNTEDYTGYSWLSPEDLLATAEQFRGARKISLAPAVGELLLGKKN